MSDTPRVDAIKIELFMTKGEAPIWNLARELERSLAEEQQRHRECDEAFRADNHDLGVTLHKLEDMTTYAERASEAARGFLNAVAERHADGHWEPRHVDDADITGLCEELISALSIQPSEPK